MARTISIFISILLGEKPWPAEARARRRRRRRATDSCPAAAAAPPPAAVSHRPQGDGLAAGAPPSSLQLLEGMLPVQEGSSAPNKDVYMYRGDQGFCSEECRWQQIMADKAREHEAMVRKERRGLSHHQHHHGPRSTAATRVAPRRLLAVA